MQVEGNDRQEERHELHDHLLLRVDHRSRTLTTLDLTLLVEAEGTDHENQDDVGETLDEVSANDIESGVGQVEDSKKRHVGTRRQVLKELGAFVEVLRVEPLGFLDAFNQGRVDTAVAESGTETTTETDIVDSSGDTSDHLVQNNKDRRLDEQRETATHRIDAVGLIKRHDLLVLQFFVVFVVLLHRLEVRLQTLHFDHRLRAREGQRRHDDHHAKREERDRAAEGWPDGIQPGENATDQVKHDPWSSLRSGVAGLAELSDFRGGTGSSPCPPQGLQRQIRQPPKQEPLTTPCTSIASMVYVEHDGTNRHGDTRFANAAW